VSNDEEPVEETQGEARAEDLTDELARKYDPERLLKIVSHRAGKGEKLEHSIRSRYERRFGVDLGHVRIYTGEFAEEFNRQRNAHAVTIGSTGMILMGGSPDKSIGSNAGQALLAHELTHVAQAQRGMHRKASFDGGMPFAEEHEAEAEQTEAAVMQEAAGGSPGGGESGTNAMEEKAASAEGMKATIEKIKERVLEMAADVARTQMVRNGIARRA
jgi:hypothetical protein